MSPLVRVPRTVPKYSAQFRNFLRAFLIFFYAVLNFSARSFFRNSAGKIGCPSGGRQLSMRDEKILLRENVSWKTLCCEEKYRRIFLYKTEDRSPAGKMQQISHGFAVKILPIYPRNIRISYFASTLPLLPLSLNIMVLNVHIASTFASTTPSTLPSTPASTLFCGKTHRAKCRL